MVHYLRMNSDRFFIYFFFLLFLREPSRRKRHRNVGRRRDVAADSSHDDSKRLRLRINCLRQSRFGGCALIDNIQLSPSPSLTGKVQCAISVHDRSNEESADHVQLPPAISRSCNRSLTFNQCAQFPVPNGRED